MQFGIGAEAFADRGRGFGPEGEGFFLPSGFLSTGFGAGGDEVAPIGGVIFGERELLEERGGLRVFPGRHPGAGKAALGVRAGRTEGERGLELRGGRADTVLLQRGGAFAHGEEKAGLGLGFGPLLVAGYGAGGLLPGLDGFDPVLLLHPGVAETGLGGGAARGFAECLFKVRDGGRGIARVERGVAKRLLRTLRESAGSGRGGAGGGGGEPGEFGVRGLRQIFAQRRERGGRAVLPDECLADGGAGLFAVHPGCGDRLQQADAAGAGLRLIGAEAAEGERVVELVGLGAQEPFEAGDGLIRAAFDAADGFVIGDGERARGGLVAENLAVNSGRVFVLAGLGERFGRVQARVARGLPGRFGYSGVGRQLPQPVQIRAGLDVFAGLFVEPRQGAERLGTLRVAPQHLPPGLDGQIEPAAHFERAGFVREHRKSGVGWLGDRLDGQKQRQ